MTKKQMKQAGEIVGDSFNRCEIDWTDDNVALCIKGTKLALAYMKGLGHGFQGLSIPELEAELEKIVDIRKENRKARNQAKESETVKISDYM